MFGTRTKPDCGLGRVEMTNMPGPSDPGPILLENPSHGETCPECGTITRHWFYEATTIYLECEHCGFKGQISNTPLSGVRVDGASRRLEPLRG